MTITEMHRAIKLELDKTSSLELPSFEPEEIDYWLNVTINDFIKQRIPSNRDKVTIEETKKVIDELRTLVVPPTTLTSVVHSYYPNNYCFILPSDYIYDLEDEVVISYTNSITGLVETKRTITKDITSNTHLTSLRDPFSEHVLYLNDAKPLKLVREDTTAITPTADIVYITDGTYTITNCYLTYIKEPAVVSLSGVISCDLPDFVHQDIVKLTAVKMLENIESPRYMTLSNELLRSE